MNAAVVAGTILAGVGETVLNKILNTMNVPPMSARTYAKHSTPINKEFEDQSMEDIMKAGKKAAKIVRERGDLNVDGIPLITVKGRDVSGHIEIHIIPLGNAGLLYKAMHGVKYHKMIGDGDSAVYKAILAKNPYIQVPLPKNLNVKIISYTIFVIISRQYGLEKACGGQN